MRFSRDPPPVLLMLYGVTKISTQSDTCVHRNDFANLFIFTVFSIFFLHSTFQSVQPRRFSSGLPRFRNLRRDGKIPILRRNSRISIIYIVESMYSATSISGVSINGEPL